MPSNVSESRAFWAAALAWTGSVTPKVMGRVVVSTLLSLVTTYVLKKVPSFHLAVGLLEVSGAVIGLLLIIRTNAGYDRWGGVGSAQTLGRYCQSEPQLEDLSRSINKQIQIMAQDLEEKFSIDNNNSMEL